MGRRRLVAVIVVAFVGGACGGGSDTPARGASDAGTTVATYGGVPGAAQGLACTNDAKQLQQQSDYYAALHGHPAESLQTFVEDGAIDHVPSNDHGYVITYDGSSGKVAASGACTFP